MRVSTQVLLGLAALGGLGLSSQAAFVAYNDVIADANPGTASIVGVNAPNTTTFGPDATQHQLKDFATGATVAEKVQVVNNGANTSGTGAGTEFNIGSDAYSTFNGKAANAGKLMYYGTGTWSVDLAFTNLQPGTKYTLATTLDRGTLNGDGTQGVGYTNRWTVISLVSADSSTYASTAGAFQVSPTAVSIQSLNTVNGYVARWTDIVPGADNAFSVHFTYATAGQFPSTSSQDGIKGYGPGMFQLTAVPEPASLSLLGLGGLLFARRRAV